MPDTLPERPSTDASPPPRRRSTTVWQVAGVVTMLAIALFWLWIFSGAARRENPDFLGDRAWVERAEETCTATMAEVDRRGASAGRQDRRARADAIDASTEDLQVMLDRLGDPLPDTASDRDVVEIWLDDWGRLLEDRTTYATAVRADPDARFLTEEKFNDPLDKVIEVFAEVNRMPACGPAGDVG